MLENVIPPASVTVKMVLKGKHVMIVTMDFMEIIAYHANVIQMVLIQAKIVNVIPMMVHVYVGMAMKEKNVIHVKEIIISQTLSVLDVIAM